ncbi:MAG: hypothetical protein FD167_1272 [bacterium]|nr:MAG: hypothetical protein FD167_1272 [bacterium]
MPKKKTSKPLLRLLECELSLPKVESEDELATLIRSINDMAKEIKNKSSQPPKPQPPRAA